ncbi:DNA-directed DNA polymerase [Senna tora]|uniref:DNA-directed DNA polymerase n=1 Tax=Senna tora TaxID=362788 RepID=A0A834SYZ4_9FABA|nr:DNA-directed DNA polymerase [Senna tora]
MRKESKAAKQTLEASTSTEQLEILSDLSALFAEGNPIIGSLIHLLPKFRGLMNEDPYQHLKEFHVDCSSMKPERVTEEQIKLRAFPFSLDDAAKESLFNLPSGSVTSWEEMMSS